jgi:hypothetical protein
MRTKGAKNKMLRKDSKLSRLAVLEALEPIQGAYVTSGMIRSLMLVQRSQAQVNKIVRILVEEGILSREGKHSDKRGFVYKVNSKWNGET